MISNAYNITRYASRASPVTRHKVLKNDGIALLMVLWILTVLSVIVLTFSYMARTETLSTISFKENLEEKFLAEAGIERGVAELFYRTHYKDQEIEFEGTEVWRTDGTVYVSQLGSGSYSVSIVDDSGKVDINEASDVLLRNLFLSAGIEAGETEIIVDSIIDWRDQDDLHRLNGAENDYYQSLPNPYQAKNGKFNTVEELILVRGITYEILYGDGKKKGIFDLLTVHAETDSINIKAAPREVLMAIPGMTPEIADQLLSIRETREVTSIEEIPGISPETLALMDPYISTDESDTFTVLSVGKKTKAKGGYAIKATVILSGIDEFTYAYYKSPVF